MPGFDRSGPQGAGPEPDAAWEDAGPTRGKDCDLRGEHSEASDGEVLRGAVAEAGASAAEAWDGTDTECPLPVGSPHRRRRKPKPLRLNLQPRRVKSRP